MKSENQLKKSMELLNQDNTIVSKEATALTISDAICGTQISFLSKSEGEMIAVGLVSKLILELSVFFNTTFNADGVKMIAQMIVRQYWYMKFEEVVLIFRDAIAGKYGKVYGQLSFAQIMEWIEKHEQNRNEHFENEHSESKHLDTSSRLNFVNDTLGEHTEPEIKKESKRVSDAKAFWKIYEDSILNNNSNETK